MFVNHERASLVFDTLLASLNKNEFPYNASKTPQKIVGEKLQKYSKLEQSRYWFFLCMYMRGPVDSNYAATKLFEIFEAQGGGGIFDPSCPHSQNPEAVDVVMSHFNFTRLLSDVKKFWVFAAKKLALLYEGDPRKIFDNIKDFDEIMLRCMYDSKKKSGFMGFQKKMSSMLTYFFRDRNLISLKHFPPPVDFHLMRIMILTGVIVLEKDDPLRFRYENSSALGYEAVEIYLKRTAADPISLGDALWLLSGNLCSLSPKNAEQRNFGIFCEETVANAPPSKRKRLAAQPGLFCRTGVDLHLQVSSSTQKMKETCGRCPAKYLCNGGIPAVEYYNYGLLEYRQI